MRRRPSVASVHALHARAARALGGRPMIGRLLNLAEDVIAFLGSFVGVFLILHLVERLAHGPAMKGFL